jgi:hypothetical protein
MNKPNLTIVIFFGVVLSSDAFAQGRVDSDRILFNIRQATWKIDNNKSLTRSIKPQEKEILYSQGDSLRKLIKLAKTANGTQKVTFYFSDKPILIYVDRNNFQFTDSVDITVAVNSFTNSLDTSKNISPPYIDQFHASYYFHDDKVRFAAVVIYSDKGNVKKVRHDEKSDIAEGMKWHDLAKQYQKRKK